VRENLTWFFHREQRRGGLGSRGPGQAVRVRSLPARAAQHSPLPVSLLLGARVAAALADTGVTRLYAHQVHTIIPITPLLVEALT
jgi:hypothetical protein